MVQKTVLLSLAIKVGRHDPNAAQVQMVSFISVINIYQDLIKAVPSWPHSTAGRNGQKTPSVLSCLVEAAEEMEWGTMCPM